MMFKGMKTEVFVKPKTLVMKPETIFVMEVCVFFLKKKKKVPF